MDEVRAQFEIPGRPVPAVRMTRKGKFTSRRAHRYLAYKEAVGWAFNRSVQDQDYDKARDDLRFAVYIVVYVRHHQRHAWDIDNVTKTVLDGLNKIAWDDDRQVDMLHVSVAEARTKADERVSVEVIGYPEGAQHGPKAGPHTPVSKAGAEPVRDSDA